jgi:apolipoprotein D and lipocalin family protein
MVLHGTRSSWSRLEKGDQMRRRNVLFLPIMLSIIGGCTEAPRGIKPIENFNPVRYSGKWHEIMRLDHGFERGLTNVTATYQLKADGKIAVLNRGFDPKKCVWREAKGSAKFQSHSKKASLAVTFFWPFYGGSHVFYLDHIGYKYALVAGPNHDYMWILAREPKLPERTKNRLLSVAKKHNFAVENLILVSHGKPSCENKNKKPLIQGPPERL